MVQGGLAKIYPESYTKRVGSRRRRYQRFTVSHYRVDGKKRTRYRKSFSSLEDARFEAERVAMAIANGEGDVLKLTSTDRASYLHAIARLEPIGIPLHAAIEEYITAREHAGAGLIAAAKEFAQRHSTVALRKPVTEVVKEFLAAKEQDGMSVRYLQSLRSHLNRFADHFGMNISTVTTALIESWLRSAAKRGARTRNNIRLSIVTLFNFAKDRGYLSKSLPTEADQLAKAKDRGGKIGVLSGAVSTAPEQLAELLRSADEEAKLYLSLGAFTGLRSAELIRLEWQDVNFVRGHIEVGKSKAKTATRRLVPIQPNLATWLAPYSDCVGLVFSSENAADRTIAFAKDAKVQWPTNALRHSYATFRLAQCQDAARVALEMGNSPQMLFRNYRELADEKDAAAWFNIGPPETATNVVILSLVRGR